MPLRHQAFLGDVAALCHLDLGCPQHPYHILLAGIGSQLHVYSLNDHAELAVWTVLDGVIRLRGIQGIKTSTGALLLLHGARIAQVAAIACTGHDAPVHLETTLQLATFPEWTMDGLIWHGRNGWPRVAVGLSNNSVAVYGRAAGTLQAPWPRVLQASCSEKLLLYSQALYLDAREGHEQDIWVVAGTVFLDVLIWKCCQGAAEAGCTAEQSCPPLYCLKGHKGSIHRVVWAPDGQAVASASDDRSVMIWQLPEEPHGSADSSTVVVEATSVLIGHQARLWDAKIAEDLVVTASEDCTCRVWHKGVCKAVLQGHKGRGIWRLQLLPNLRLATAGADGSIKVWPLASFLPAEVTAAAASQPGEEAAGAPLESFRLSQSVMQSRPGTESSIASKREDWVRPMALASHHVLYIGTHQGRLQRVQIPCPGLPELWEQLWDNGHREALMCLAVSRAEDAEQACSVRSTSTSRQHDLLLTGTQSGAASLIQVPRMQLQTSLQRCAELPAATVVSWQAHGGEPVLGSFWAACCGADVAITAALHGGLRLWSVAHLLGAATKYSCNKVGVDDAEHALMAEAMSPYGARILEMDISLELGLLVCGDRWGNVAAFSLPEQALSCEGTVRLPLVAAVKGSAPHMPISLVSILPIDSTVTVASHDGCLRHYRYTPPGHAAGASNSLAASLSPGRASGSLPDHGRAPSSTYERHSALGSDSCHAEAEEREHQSKSSPSSHKEEGPDIDKDRLPVDSLKALDMADASREACSNDHQKRTDHDREECSHSKSKLAEQSGGQRLDDALGESREQGGHSTALGNLSVEAVSALTVIESQLLYCSEGEGRPDQLLTGFQADDWILYSTTHQAELARVRCGGWRRQYTHIVSTPSTFTFACYQNRNIHVDRRRDESDLSQLGGVRAGQSVQSMHAMHHGREIQCVQLLQAPEPHQATAVVTGGEDSTLRSFVLQPKGTGHVSLVTDSMEVAEHAAGSSVKAMAAVQNGPGSWYVVTAGSKEVLMAWAQSFNASSSSAGPCLQHQWLATRPPPRTGLRPQSRKQGASVAATEHRYLALAVLPVQAGCLHIVAASSSATLQLLGLDLMTKKWVHITNLEGHASPVLSLASLELPENSFARTSHPGHLIVSGATDGSMALWHVQLPGSAAAPIQAVPEVTAERLLCLPCLHQSGVNAVSMSLTPDSTGGHPEVIIATGGDDQALSALKVALESKERLLGTVKGSVMLASAHSSAIKSVWTDGRSILSVGLDQRLRSWNVKTEQEGGVGPDSRASSGIMTQRLEVDEADSCAVQVLEPAALHAVQRHAGAGQEAEWIVGLVGRGTQVLGYKKNANQTARSSC